MQQIEMKEERSRSQCVLLERTWDTLNEITTDLKNQGLIVPSEVYTSLRSVKSLIGMCETHPKLSELAPSDIDSYLGFCVACCGQDVVTRIKCELRNVEDHLIIQAMNELGSEQALRMQQKTLKAWEPLQERIIPSIESFTQAVKVEKDLVSAYQRVVDENISYWISVEDDMMDSYTRLMNGTDDPKTKSALTGIIQDTKGHLETLASIKQSFKKISADAEHHAKMLEELQ
jgi:hypothetical protein